MCGDNNRIKKIVWIDGVLKSNGTTTNFTYNITGALPLSIKNVTVKMEKCLIANTGGVSVNSSYLKIYGDLGTSHNQYALNYASSLLLGLINVQYPNFYWNGVVATNYVLLKSCEELSSEQIEYKIERPQNFINITILDEDNAVPLLIGGGALPDPLICLEFEYELN